MGYFFKIPLKATTQLLVTKWVPIMMNNVELKKVDKQKYLGCYFHAHSCKVDTRYGIGKFYGNFNNILSVIGYNKNEMATLHLVKPICANCAYCFIWL